MKGDFTRDTFDPTKHYQQVLMQQGRAQLDADWNEQAELTERRDETTAADLIGNCGGPADGAAFAVFTDAAKLSEADKAGLKACFATLPATRCPVDLTTFALKSKADFYLSPGRYYVDGIQCENEFAIPYTAQPDRLDVEPLAGTPNGKSYLVYQDVWDRHITVAEDADIRESALGGPDTATRVKTIWQVRALELSAVDASNPCSSGATDFHKLFDPGTAMLTAGTVAPPTDDNPCLVPPSAGYTGLENQLYRVEIHDQGAPIDAASNVGSTEVTLASDLPITGFVDDDEPRLRHAIATWKWSRENGSVVTPIEKIDGKKVTVSSLGPDKNLGFVKDAWVEILDDAVELEGQPGQLAQIDDVDEATRIITLKSAASILVPADPKFPQATYPNGIVLERHPKLRRWEGVGNVKDATNAPLENGVEITFDPNGNYRTGHFWQIPARTATAQSPKGDIEWPRELDASGQPQKDKPLPQPPRGITHHYCRLGIITILADGTLDANAIQDCRCLWPALTAVPRLFYVSGDGQEVMPDLLAAPTSGFESIGIGNLHQEVMPDLLAAPTDSYKLPQPLVVGVANAQCLKTPLTVGFGVTEGDGYVVAQDGTVGKTVGITTDAAGLASCDFYLDGTNWSQQVTATLLDANSKPVSLPLIFNANLSIASQVAYDPGTCGALQGQNTVQEAISRLAVLAHIEIVGGDGQDAAPDETLAKPLKVSVTSKCGPLSGATVSFSPDAKGVVKDPTTLVTGAPGDPLNISTVDGIATCLWTPDPDQALGTQQLTAKLVTTSADYTIEKPDFVQFTANVRAASEAGSCCCVTVGPNGDYKTLKEALGTLQRQGVQDICLCLLPGDHKLDNYLDISLVSGAAETHVRIGGCGRGSRLLLATQKDPTPVGLVAHSLTSFTLSDLSVVAFGNNPNPIIIADCAEVSITGCFLSHYWYEPTDLLTVGTGEARGRILIADNWIESQQLIQGSPTGRALVIADAFSDTAILNNTIIGDTRFYGDQGAFKPDAFYVVAQMIVGNQLGIDLHADGADARIEGNNLMRLVVDQQILSAAGNLGNLFRRVSLLNNTFHSGGSSMALSQSQWLGEHIISNGNYFMLGDAGVVGTAAGASIICIGTSSWKLLDSELQVATPELKVNFEQSANLITLTAVPIIPPLPR